MKVELEPKKKYGGIWSAVLVLGLLGIILVVTVVASPLGLVLIAIAILLGLDAALRRQR